MNQVSENFLSSTIQLYSYYRSLGENAMDQLSVEQLFHRPTDNDNSIAVIVGHLHGNMLSRWTDFMNSDGEKKWREREQEFEPFTVSKQELEKKWSVGWDLVLSTLKELQPEDMSKTVYIRNMSHTVLEALNRQVTHYAYHVGQIVFYAKMLKGNDWQSLSIPKGQSEKYNAEKFSQPKNKQHFTDDFVNRYDK